VVAKANRLVRADDYKVVVRRGVRRPTEYTLLYIRRAAVGSPVDLPVRFGFIVAKTVGNAVVRNRVRRRLKSIAAELVPTVPSGTDIVVRALPAASQASWTTLRDQLADALSRGLARA